MKNLIRRVFVVLWIIAGLFGLIAVIALLDSSIRGGEGVFFNWLFCCVALLATQYIVTGTPNPVRMFNPPD